LASRHRRFAVIRQGGRRLLGKASLLLRFVLLWWRFSLQGCHGILDNEGLLFWILMLWWRVSRACPMRAHTVIAWASDNSLSGALGLRG